ncbi:DUF2939 domain-containing protein [Brevundimonas bullata]|uniref:DUF2939 domain-containing protein n=1 Tax=Brevundimonas bullata TaxID=13160 RepID=UPI002FD949C5
MNQKLIIRLGGAAVAVFVLAYAASPLLAARSLVQAAKTGNEQALERQVDFPAFRASLKDELSARMVAEMRKDDRLGGLSGLGMLLAPTLVSGAVDAFVTPQAIAVMVQEGQGPKPDQAKPEAGPNPESKPESQKVRQSWGYRDLDTFAVTLTRDDQPDEQVSLLMKRRNLFGWKLAGIDLSAPE